MEMKGNSTLAVQNHWWRKAHTLGPGERVAMAKAAVEVTRTEGFIIYSVAGVLEVVVPVDQAAR